MQKLLIVDGSNLLFQMFYGMPARIFNQDGKAIHGTLGFVGALLKIIRITKPSHAVVLFDGECHNERKDLNEDYKANRPDYSKIPEEELPFSQEKDVCAALDYLKIAHTQTTVCETDDIIAAYAFKLGNTLPIVISSFDSDFFQLINDNVCVLRYRGDKSTICDKEYIRQKLEIEPSQYADFKSLTGDTADNITGAEKVGPKTAAKLIRQFGCLDNLLEQSEEIQSETLRNSILKSKERLKINQLLIRLGDKAELPFSLNQLELQSINATTNDVLHAIGLK